MGPSIPGLTRESLNSPRPFAPRRAPGDGLRVTRNDGLSRQQRRTRYCASSVATSTAISDAATITSAM
jgi:hypothetical protein